ncbi:unnamed protein product [Arctogadus glacialis]
MLLAAAAVVLCTAPSLVDELRSANTPFTRPAHKSRRREGTSGFLTSEIRASAAQCGRTTSVCLLAALRPRPG